MWYEGYLVDILKFYLPIGAKIIKLKNYKRYAVDMIDLDGDGFLELVGFYNLQGKNYIIILKRYNNSYYVLDIIKGKNSSITSFNALAITNRYINNLLVGWENKNGYSELSIYGWTKKGFENLFNVYPYPSNDELLRLKERFCYYTPFSEEYGIDFSSLEYICSEKKKDRFLEKALEQAFDLIKGEDKIRYYYNKVDLNDDGVYEIFVYLVGFPVCGTGGCSAAIFKQENNDYVLLSKFSLVNNPIVISDTKTNGFKDIIMYVSGGGIESFFSKIKYNGKTYPSNPSIQPKVKPGTKVDGIAIISDDITKNPGIEF
ncbi:MAG: hypothetical protein FH751_03295 [Firmicutes bacterium]|nr:hypothetical protein [Bacillota bacterium]